MKNFVRGSDDGEEDQQQGNLQVRPPRVEKEQACADIGCQSWYEEDGATPVQPAPFANSADGKDIPPAVTFSISQAVPEKKVGAQRKYRVQKKER